MPQDIRKPLDNGRLTLPPVDSGMNRISPSDLPGNKGNNKPIILGQKDEAKKAKLLARIQKRMDRAISAESENRRNALDDRQFLAGVQWPSEVAAQRNLDKRPCLTINLLPTFVNQIANDQRQNRPSIAISPTGDHGDPEVAKMYRGLIRFIERDCGANSPNGAYDTGFVDAVRMGWGYWRVLTEWEAPDSFNLVLVVRRIRNPFSVYLDPSAQEIDGSGAKWGLITEMVPRHEFEEKWPEADPMPFAQGGAGEAQKNWQNKDEVRIAEYFEIEYKTRTLIELSNGHTGWEDDLDDITQALLDRGRLWITDEREARVPQVLWYKVTAVDILMEREWIGSSIPIIKCTGREIDLEGKIRLSGIVRDAKDAQRMLNYWETSQTELIALQPKAPWIVEEGQIEGHEDEWRNANVRNQPYLSYKGTSVAGTQAPPPQRQPMAGIPAGIVQAKLGATQNLLAITGIHFDPTTSNARILDESGKAIQENRANSDLGSFDFVDNFTQALRRTGEILVECIPKVYSTTRIATIIRDDDKEELVKIDPTMQKPTAETRGADGKTMKLFNPKIGKYGVTVTIGPNYATKRVEAAASMMQFCRALPQTAALISDLIAKNQDWPGAEEIAARLAKTLPPNLLAPDQKDMTPQTQALLSAVDGQIKELGQKLQAAMAALQDKTADRAVDMEKIRNDFEVKLLQIVSNMETKLAATQERATSNFNAHIGAQLQELGTGVTTLLHAMEAAPANDAAPPESPPTTPSTQPAAPEAGP